jgi:hypothetical protein
LGHLPGGAHSLVRQRASHDGETMVAQAIASEGLIIPRLQRIALVGELSFCFD